MIFALDQIYWGNQVDGNEMGRICSIYMGDKNCIEGFSQET